MSELCLCTLTLLSIGLEFFPSASSSIFLTTRYPTGHASQLTECECVEHRTCAVCLQVAEGAQRRHVCPAEGLCTGTGTFTQTQRLGGYLVTLSPCCSVAVQCWFGLRVSWWRSSCQSAKQPHRLGVSKQKHLSDFVPCWYPCGAVSGAVSCIEESFVAVELVSTQQSRQPPSCPCFVPGAALCCCRRPCPLRVSRPGVVYCLSCRQSQATAAHQHPQPPPQPEPCSTQHCVTHV
jgi:hypothetical protein